MLSRADFLIRDDITFLNHGSFGACPKPVFERYQAWQLELERQPVDFLLRNRERLMAEARAHCADYLNIPAEDMVFVSNATSGLNVALRSLPLGPGDEILTTSHEYGAVMRLLEFVAAKTGARIIRHEVGLPYQSDEEFVEAFFSAASPRAKVIVISHIASPSSLIFPVEQVCCRARQLGILSVIDGAHAPSQMPLDLRAIDADIYSGNFHKWLCAPKGSAFLYVRPDCQAMIEPLVISHGWRQGSAFVERNGWSGTRDIAPFLSVPVAIEFQRRHDWSAVRAACHELAAQAQAQICGRYGLPPLSRDQFAQMVTIPLPSCDATAVQHALYADYRIEAPLGEFMGRCGIRVSLQAYNSADDIERLMSALGELIG